jgi:hypothetical protein
VTRIPADAFDYYVSLDAERSYQAVAEKYGVSKRAVTQCAKREGWAERLAAIEQEAREKMDKRLAESLEERRERHLTVIRAMLSRSVAALQKYPLNSAMDAVKTAEKAIKLERLVVGEVADRTAVVEEIVKREYEQWMEHDAGEEEAVP